MGSAGRKNAVRRNESDSVRKPSPRSLGAKSKSRRARAEPTPAEEATRALARVGRELVGTLDLARVTDQIVSVVLGLFRVRRSTLYQTDPASGSLLCVAAAGVGDSAEWLGRRLPVGTGLAGLAVREGRQVSSADPLTDSRFTLPEWARQRVVAEGYSSAVALPLVVRGDVLGALVVGDHIGRVFTEEELRLMSAFADQAAQALQNARLFEEERRRAVEAEALRDMATALSSTLDLKEIQRVLAQRSARAVGAERCTISLWRDGHLVPTMVQYANGHHDEALWEKFRAMRPYRWEGIPVFAEVIRTRRPVVVEDARTDPLFPTSWVDAFGTRSALVVPLVWRDQVIGALYLDQTSTPYSWSERQIELATTIASQATLAIENARLYERAEERAGRLTALSGLTRLMTSARGSQAAFEAVAEAAATLLGAKAARVWVSEPDGRVLRVGGSFGVDPEAERRLMDFVVIPYGSGIPGRIAESGAPEWVSDAHDDPRWMNLRFIKEFGIHGYAGLPLIAGGRVVGVLSIYFGERREFTAEEKELGQLLADQAAIALENTRLYEDQEVRSARLGTLSRLSQLVSSSLDIETVLGEIARAAVALTAAPVVSFCLADEASQTVEVRVFSDEASGANLPARTIPLGRGLLGWVTVHRRPLDVPDVFSDERIGDLEWWRTHGLTSFYGVPIVHENVLVGVLALNGRAPFGFGPIEEDLINSFAAQAAVAIRNAHLFAQSEERRREAEAAAKALLESESQYRGLVEGSIQGIYIHKDFIIRLANPATARIFGYESPAELIGRSLEVVIAPHELPRLRGSAAARLRGENPPARYEYQGVRKDGSPVWVETLVSIISWDSGPVFLATLLDITERKRAEEALRRSEEGLRQAQKMDAVGRLAGGIAHDFNNLLTVINGRSQLLLDRLRPEDLLRRDIDLILRTGKRAATLTQQLLAFSRKQVLQPTVLDLNAVVTGMEGMLRRLITEDIELCTVLDPALGRIKADPGQLEQIILNLVVNARDAMPTGGRLAITTTKAAPDGEFVPRHPGAGVGAHVMLTVSDTGVGMDADTQAHLFEPFFTTKGPGKGTGLGLSTVYGIVAQHGGSITVASAPGRGSTFTIYLPRTEDDAVSKAAPAAVEPRPGEETILLVEDDEEVRSLAREILEVHGYAVLEARLPAEAISIAEAHPGPIHLVLTDVVMPGMSGRELTERLARLRPGLKVLYMSGYTADELGHHGVLDPRTALLPKPFSPDALALKVREVLESVADQ